MDHKFEELIGSYMDTKTGICDQFLTAELAVNLKENLLKLAQDEQMKPAGIGNQVRDILQTKRGDKVSWIDPYSNDANERAFLDQIENFIGYLNDSCYTGINAYEFHYALYEPGSFYKRHVDQFSNNSDRKLSMIHYLNEDWLTEDGGELWIHHPDKLEKIQPNIRKAVLFRSSDCEHEVREASRARMSITGWLKSR
jgi:SM-20-related protein